MLTLPLTGTAVTIENARHYIKTAYNITDVSDQVLDVALGETFEGVPYLNWIGLLIKADEIHEDFNNGEYYEGLYLAYKSSADFAFIESLSLIGLHGVAVTASLANAPITYAIEKFYEEINKTAYQNQINIYIEARRLGYSHEDILSHNGDLLLFTDDGWLYIIVGDMHIPLFSHPANKTPEQVYNCARDEWEAHLLNQEYIKNKESIGEQFKHLIYYPEAFFNISSTSRFPPLQVHFDATGSKPALNANIVSYEWNFGDGSTSELGDPPHTYSTPGTYTVVFKATDGQGNFESRTISIVVHDVTSVLSISSATGSPAPSSGGTTDPAPGDYSYELGTLIQMIALNFFNYRFSNWTGDLDDSDRYSNQITVLMDKDKHITAHLCAKCGDTNGDLAIAPADAQVAFDIYLGRNANPSECQRENADVNCDGTKSAPRITPADAQAILDQFLGRNELPSDCSGLKRSTAMVNSSLPLRQNLRATIESNLLAKGNELIVLFFWRIRQGLELSDLISFFRLRYWNL